MARKPGAQRVRELGPCVVLEGGPRHAWWYTEADMRAMVETAELALRRGQRIHEPISGYRPTSDVRLHPNERDFPGLAGKVWRWSP